MTSPSTGDLSTARAIDLGIVQPQVRPSVGEDPWERAPRPEESGPILIERPKTPMRSRLLLQDNADDGFTDQEFKFSASRREQLVDGVC